MKGNNILSSLCYFSIFFAPFLLPIIVYFVAEDEVKYHAKKAFWSHVFPYAILFGGLALSGVYGLSFNQSDERWNWDGYNVCSVYSCRDLLLHLEYC